MRIVSGMRPTGKLHLGHYLGVIRNWLELQKEHECYFFIADWHALSTTYEDKINLKETSLSMAREWLACGIDPNKSSLYFQSHIPEIGELYILLNMITPLGWLERNPTYKDQVNQMQGKNIQTAGFFTYPVLMSSDILLFDGEAVPIGEDQQPHLEICREIARRFHHLYECDVFHEPKDMLSPTPRLLGLDGRKMSKSYHNAIYLSDTSEEVWQKLRGAKTDPQRVRRDDPGNPDVCLVYGYHQELTEENEVQRIEESCRAGTIGCVECKKIALASINTLLDPIREKLEEFTPEKTEEVLLASEQPIQQKAKEKMHRINDQVLNRSS